MRRQSVWLRLFALLVLIPLVVPVSAQVAFCMAHPAMQKCCKAKEAPKHVEAVEKDSCCADKETATSPEVPQTGISDEKSELCKCFWDSAPTQPTNDLNSPAVFAPPVVAESPLAFTEILFTFTFETSLDVQRIFFGDSSPPKHADIASHAGRAPPIL